MSLGLWLGIVFLMFTVFGVPEKTNEVTITAIKGTIEVEDVDGNKYELPEGEEVIIESADESLEWIDIENEE